VTNVVALETIADIYTKKFTVSGNAILSSENQLAVATSNMALTLEDVERSNKMRLDEIKAEQDAIAQRSEGQRTILDQVTEIYRLTAEAFGGSYPAYTEIFKHSGKDQMVQSLIIANLSQLHAQLRNYTDPVPIPFGMSLNYTENGQTINANTFSAEKLIAKLDEPSLNDAKRQMLAAILASKSPSELINPTIKAFREKRSLFTLAVLFGRFNKLANFENTGLQDSEKIISSLEKWKLEQAKK
jgi:hypothetical protein